MRGSSSAALASVPETHDPSGRWKAPADRGKISYQAPASAFVRALSGIAGGYQLHDRAAILTELSFEDFGVFEPRSLG